MAAIERPLKMPEGYDFSSRKVNWGSYKNDYLLLLVKKSAKQKKIENK